MQEPIQDVQVYEQEAPDEQISQQPHHNPFNLIWLSRIEKHQCHRCGRPFQNMIGVWPALDDEGDRMICLGCADHVVPGLRAGLLSLDFMPGENSGAARERWEQCMEGEAQIRAYSEPQEATYLDGKEEQNPETSKPVKDDCSDSYDAGI